MGANAAVLPDFKAVRRVLRRGGLGLRVKVQGRWADRLAVTELVWLNGRLTMLPRHDYPYDVPMTWACEAAAALLSLDPALVVATRAALDEAEVPVFGGVRRAVELAERWIWDNEGGE